jgi:hypothetical protein
MPALNAMSAALAWLGRQGSRAIAAVVFIAIAVPPLDALFKPFVTEAIFALLCLAFVRVDTAALRGHIRRPGLGSGGDGVDVLGGADLDRRGLLDFSRFGRDLRG